MQKKVKTEGKHKISTIIFHNFYPDNWKKILKNKYTFSVIFNTDILFEFY